MKGPVCSKATLGRLPVYLDYLRSGGESENVSAAEISRALGLGDVQVRKDLNAISGPGRPKVGYNRKELIADLEAVLGRKACTPVIIVGAGKMGRALLDYDGFARYGIKISAAFDIAADKTDKRILPLECLEEHCRRFGIHAGIITVPASAAQEVCDLMIRCGITAVWNFAPTALTVPASIRMCRENPALSLAHLTMPLRDRKERTPI